MYNPLAFGLMFIGIGAVLFAAYLYEQRKKISEGKEKAYGLMFIINGILAGIFQALVPEKSPVASARNTADRPEIRN